MSFISGQDWEPVVLKKTNTSQHTTVHNKANNTSYKNDSNEEITVNPTVSLSNSLLIQKARTQLKLSQKDLAQKLNIDSKIIQGYESGKVIPDVKLMTKLEKILKVKLNKKKNQ